MESVNVVALRKALTEAARDMPLATGDIETLVAAAAEATTWVDEPQMLAMTGRMHNRSLSDWCINYNVPRALMARREDVVRGLNSMPGRGRRRDLRDDRDESA